MKVLRRAQVSPTLAALVVEGLLSRLALGLVSFALPLYAYRELDLSLTEIGFLTSFNMIVAVALKPLTGSFADRFGLKPGLQVGVGLRSLVSLTLVFVSAPWQLFAIRGLHGVSIAMRDPSVNALIAEHGGRKAIASAFAWYQTAKSIGGAAGKMLAGLLLGLTASNFSLVFLIGFAISALPFVVVARFVRPQPQEVEPEPRSDVAEVRLDGNVLTVGGSHEADVVQRSPSAFGGRSRQPRPPIFRFMGLGFLVSTTAYMLTTLFPIFAVEYAGLSEAQAGLIYGFSSVMALTGPAFGWLSDNVSRKLVLSLRSVANVLSSVMYWTAPSFAGVAAGRALDDAGKAAFRPAWGAVMAHVSSFDRRRRARAMGYLSSGDDAGEIVGPILAGFLWSTWGIPVLLGARILLAVVTELVAIALAGALKRLDSDAKTLPFAMRSAQPAQSVRSSRFGSSAETRDRAQGSSTTEDRPR